VIGGTTARAGAVPAIAGFVGLLLLAAAPGDRRSAAPSAVLIDGRDLYLQVIVAEGDSARFQVCPTRPSTMPATEKVSPLEAMRVPPAPAAP
jgi:hypothetical protein